MTGKRSVIFGAVAALGLGASALVHGAPALAQSALAMLDSLERGQWTVRFRDGSPPRRICVHDGRELIQIQHMQSGCSRIVVDDGPRQVTVQYSCRGNGYGRTSIRRETGSLVQIDSQGIAGGQPFQFSAEARRTGNCN